MHRVVIVGPTSAPWAEIADSVEDDLRHLQRAGLEVSYVTTGGGPVSIRSAEDELAAAPHVVETVTRIADSCDAIVVDCTGDPGVATAREIVDVPVVGAGEAIRRAAGRSPSPVAILSGDELRAATMADLVQQIAGAATVVVSATGQREVAQALRLDDAITVIEPLEAAIDWCVELIDQAPGTSTPSTSHERPPSPPARHNSPRAGGDHMRDGKTHLSPSPRSTPMKSQQDRTVVITGGTGGIGFQSALGIAETGAHVVITGRNHERGDAVVQRIIDETGNGRVELVVGDVSSIEGIDALAHALVERVDHIDVLVNNAGYMGSTPASSDDGLEMHFAVNVLAPWRLTWALLPALKAADHARVLNITGGDKPAAIDPDDLQAEKGFRGLMTYTHSKSAMEAMSMALAEQLEPEGVTVNVLFPGRASTSMTGSMSPSALPGAMKLMYPFLRLLFRDDDGKSAKKAARSTIWGATSAALDGATGRYFDTNSKERKLHATAYDPDVQARILEVIGSTTAGPPSQ